MHAPQALTVKPIRLTRVALILDLAAGWKIFRKFWRHPCIRVTHDENAFQTATHKPRRSRGKRQLSERFKYCQMAAIASRRKTG